MTLKIFFLLISIVVLNLFVTIIPVLGNGEGTSSTGDEAEHSKAQNDSDEETSSEAAGEDDPEVYNESTYYKPQNDNIKYNDLVSFETKYNAEITEYCKKYNIPTSNEEQRISASLLYFKELLETVLLYSLHFEYDANECIKLFIEKKDAREQEIQTDLQEHLNTFKSSFQEITKQLFENLTFFPLPQNIENEYYLEHFRMAYALANTYDKFIGKSQVTVKQILDRALDGKSKQEPHKHEVTPFCDTISENEYSQFVVHYIKELHELNKNVFTETTISLDKIKLKDESQERKTVVNEYLTNQMMIYSQKKWQLEKFQSNDIFVRYLIHEKTESHDIKKGDTVNILENGVEKPMEVMPAFLKYFKESLDNYFKYHIEIDITKVTDEANKNLFYSKMLKAMSNTYNAQFEDITKGINVSSFVQLMVNKAEAILESNKNKKIAAIILYEVMSEDGDSLENYMTKYYEANANMPEKVEWKKVLDYLIYNIKNDSKA